ncbi:hypothetical protein MIND_01356500 [Mycena indigotica]|uniref:DUF7137 domain-containing protein n=1 Tax=Mycena indigotica TaxID=2126181 RepID=A0A8H6RZQ7_9AGAR|nr:uncharacterized protein MIND_01356500 [Mycena indigotica]KAF7289822.1 hypothetical protein MIND_01356500 [Mycena indigotica]
MSAPVSPSGAASGASSGTSSGAPSGNPVAPSGSATSAIPQTLPPGGATITQPPQTATSYFKIAPNQLITFGWNLTSVVRTPTSLTISAVGANGNTYAVGPDEQGRVPGTATQVVWDVYSYQQAHPGTQLAQAQYTLHIFDERGPTATAQAGLMSPNTALTFALYTPQGYTPLADGWSCTGCNGALAARPAAFGLLFTFLIMLISGIRIFRSRA